MKKDTGVFIEHILENIEDVEFFIKGVSKKDFLKNKEKQNAVIRSIEVIGEAVKNIPENIKEKYKKVRWKDIAGTRDKLTHHYFGVDIGLIWGLAKENLIELKKQMLEIKRELAKLGNL